MLGLRPARAQQRSVLPRVHGKKRVLARVPCGGAHGVNAALPLQIGAHALFDVVQFLTSDSCESCPPPPSGITKRPRSASTAFDRAKAVRKRAWALPVTHSLSAPATLMLPALCKELPAGFFAAFDLVCSLPPLPLCGGVSDKTHMSFRTRYAAAAERNKKRTKSSEAPAPPYCSQKVGFPRQSGGQGACPLCFSGGRAGGGLFQKRPSLANRQGASALLICRAALGTPRAAPRKADSLSQRDHPLLAARGRQPF